MLTSRDFVALLLISLSWSLLIWHLITGNRMDLYWKGTPAGGGVEVVRIEYVYRRPPPWSATLVPIYVITPTFQRAVQKAELTRMAHTFLHVANLHWIVIEDAQNATALVGRLLKSTGLNYTHLHTETPRRVKEIGYPRGSSQRNLGLHWLRLTMGEAPPGVVYFADDDNVYSLELFEEMRSTTMVSVWPVGLIAGRKFESPKINAQGKVCGWDTGFAPNRKFAIDMAGFAINLELLIRKSEVVFKLQGIPGGYQETDLLSGLVSVKDLEPKADNCTKVLVWHTRTQRPTLVKDGQRGFTNPDIEV